MCEQRKELGDRHTFRVPPRALLGKNREGYRDFVDDANGKRPGKRQKVGAMEKGYRAHCAGCPRNIHAGVLNCEGMV